MIATREAVPGDNEALIALTAACPMVGDITMCSERGPDFFALNQLEGKEGRVAIASDSEGVTGCIAVSERRVYLHGDMATTTYASDLKVHPRARGGMTTIRLMRWGNEAISRIGSRGTPCFFTIMSGNRRISQLVSGRLGLPASEWFAKVRVYAIPLLFRTREKDLGLRIARAREEDIEVMVALWLKVAPERNFAPVFDVAGFRDWIQRAPGLSVQDYWLAWRADGQLAGFAGLWDQGSFKRLRVLAYSTRLRLMRAAINAVGRLTGGATLPPTGEPLHTATVVHVCIPGTTPEVLRALLLRMSQALRAQRYTFFAIGLDVRDPLTVALNGLMAQPTEVHAFVTSYAGEYRGRPLSDRPFHYEIALV